MRAPRGSALVAAIWSLALCPWHVHGASTKSLQTTVVSLRDNDESYLGSNAYDEGWGVQLPMQQTDRKREYYRLLYTSTELGLTDRFGCTSVEALDELTPSAPRPPVTEPFALLVDRGQCTFTAKAFNAQRLGASALIVVDTLEQLYNRTLQDDALVALEYDCARGRGSATSDALTLKDAKWQENANVSACTTKSSCTSSMCVPTGNGREVCCAWDLPDLMGFGAIKEAQQPEDITIPVMRLGIAAGDELKSELALGKQFVTFFARDPPIMDPSQFLLWLLAIVTVLVGGYKGSAAERQQALLNAAMMNPSVAADDPRLNAIVRGSQVSPNGATNRHGQGQERERADDDEEETLELTIYHAVGFVIVGSAFLLLLFYVNIVIVIVVLCAFSSITCTYVELWFPLLNRVYFFRAFPLKRFGSTRIGAYLEVAQWSVADVIAMALAIFFAVFWFVKRHEPYSWIFQDIYGICLCVIFMKTIRLPNLRIGTVLMVLIFIYDIFMVFISPYIFKESVMIKAATGGNQAAPRYGEAYCIRYPTDSENDCVREQIPILFRLPKMLDWRGGQSMLGFGDIVLPGVLIVFCARYDYATRGQLMGNIKPALARMKSLQANSVDLSAMEEDPTPSIPSPQMKILRNPPKHGLFGIMMWGYAIGLAMANTAVILMEQGQPALLYIVPTTWGVLMLIAWHRGILKELWDGPVELQRQRKSQENDEDVEDPEVVQDTPSAHATPSVAYEQTPSSPQRANRRS